MEFPAAQKEHQWLQQLIGDWTYESASTMGEQEFKMTGTDSVRSLGDLWIVANGTMPSGGADGVTQMTLGFDVKRGKYVGSWVGSMMDYQWIYEGELDPTGKILTLSAEGPRWDDIPGTTMYHDIVEMVDDKTRLLRAEVRQDDGTWKEFMRTTYTRTS